MRTEHTFGRLGNLLAGVVVKVSVAGFDAAASGENPQDAGGAGDASFEAFVAGASGRLFTMALLLTGLRRAEAEDLLQDALERAYRRWRRITRTGVPEPYVRQVMVNAAVDQWRRGRRRPEQPLPAENGMATADHAAALADRDLLLRALAELPARQRAVLVLRYFADLTEEQTAATLGCSVGTVKSQASRGLARLRQITAAPGEQSSGSKSAAGTQERGTHG